MCDQTPLRSKIVERKALNKQLINSDVAYFHAGSQIIHLHQGDFAWIPSLRDFFSAAVFHWNTLPISESYLNEVESHFLKAKLANSRIYFFDMSDDKKKLLNEKGYQLKIEKGFLFDLSTFNDAVSETSCEMIEAATNQHWADKLKILESDCIGPDGHQFDANSYIEMERIKNNAGYMKSYIVYVHSKPIGMISLSCQDGLARLKNLMLHKDYRRKGFGLEIIKSMLIYSKNNDMNHVGAFSLPHTTHLYQKLDFKHVATIYEAWRHLDG